jgi:signal transduction histidine kinase
MIPLVWLYSTKRGRKRQVIRLTVRDEGVGITPEQRERLFTPFTKRLIGARGWVKYQPQNY